jgi:hypothetical protein
VDWAAIVDPHLTPPHVTDHSLRSMRDPRVRRQYVRRAGGRA